MSKADELLESIAEEGIAAYTVNPETEPHIVVNADRSITVPDELKKIAVQFDHDVETVTFDCPRYWDACDMSLMAIYINYKTPDNRLDAYPVKNVTVDAEDESMMHFTWTISRNVTQVQGNISFLVCVKNTDGNGNEINHWNSDLCKDMYVAEGLECTESILEQYPDVITQLLLRMDSIEKNGGGGSGSTSIATFEGTRAEYEARYAAGNIAVGTIVIITDEDGASGNGSSSVLGEGVLGEMILG